MTLRAVTDAPYWVGVAIVAGIVALNVALGGMRGVTYVQAFQYWVKVFAIAFPAILLLIHLGGLPARAALFGVRAAEHRPERDGRRARPAAHADLPRHGRDADRARGRAAAAARTPRSPWPRASTPRPATSGRAR